MRYLLFISVVLTVSCILSFNSALAQEKEKVIIISEKVGEVIDAEEREYYCLFPQITGFTSAVFLQLLDGSYAAEVTYEEEGGEKKAKIPQSKQTIASLKDYIENFEEIKLDLPDQEAEKAAIYLEKTLEEKPPLNSGKVSVEILAGMGAGAVLGIGAGLIGFSMTRVEDPQDFENFSGLLGAALGFAIAYPIGSVIGVYAIGNTGNETGSFFATLGGSLVGVGAGIGVAFAAGSPYFYLLGPPVGATIGFNVTRRYRNPPPFETGLINYGDANLSFAVPSIYYTQINTFESKTITHNVTLVSIGF